MKSFSTYPDDAVTSRVSSLDNEEYFRAFFSLVETPPMKDNLRPNIHPIYQRRDAI